MKEIKMLDEKEHEWLMERNPNSWCRAYFEMDNCSAAFENGISKSFNSRIIGARGKPIITMFEDIRVYIMQKMFYMNKLAFDDKDSITPSVRRHMEYNKRIQRPSKSSASSSRGGSKGGGRGGASKRGRFSNTIPFQGLRDEASDEEHQFKMDMKVVYEMKREQMAIDEDDHFWEDFAREFNHVEEHRAQDKGIPEDVVAGKQPMTKDVDGEKQPMIEDEPLQGGVDLPTQESTVEANLKHTRSKKSRAVEVPNQMRIFHKNRGRSKRIFNQKMKNFKFHDHGTRSIPDKAFDV
ncbi:hypothetical protein Tco_0205451 [Tanacetum coccineum]